MQLVVTGDGSHTLYIPALKEHYHSTYGALTESRHVFILNGLDMLASGNITVLEVGFGTGLNAFLTAMQAIDRGIAVRYYAIENYPVDPDIIKMLNYPDFFPQRGTPASDLFRLIHEAPWEKTTEIHSGFHLNKIQADLNDFFPDFCYDLLYFDAFSPDRQPEMWTAEILHRLILSFNPGGIFTTYCAKGSVRRLLIENGLAVERLPGPPGKREMLRGIKKVI